MSAETPQEDFKYWAFICYSHTDEKWATWLHRSLETYNIPKHLVGRRTREGVIPKRLFPVFRDREELPGSAKLGEEIEAALRKSRFLIVICSPRAVASKWVDQEIRIFKALGREDRVLCLVVDGEPHATTRPEIREPECLPESVRFWVDSQRNITQVPTEPIAADIRKGKDGKKNATLKLLAGILGVEYDALKQRDEERRQRQQQLVLAAAVSLLIIFSLLVAEFYDQRNEAIKAKEAAVRAQLEAKANEAKAIDAQERARQSELEALQEAQKAEKSAKEAELQKREAEEQAARARAALAKQEEARLAEEAAREKERRAKELAQENERNMKRTLAVSDFTTAARLVEEGNESKALAYLSRALRHDPENAAVVSRVISLLSYKIWGLPVINALPHEHEVSRVLFSQDGRHIITISGKAVSVWNRSTSKLQYAPLEHAAQVTSICLSPNGEFLLTTSRDRTAQIWELLSGRRVGSPLKHDDWVLHASFSSDGRWVATAGQDKSANVWETSTGKLLHSLKHIGPVREVAFTPDGRSLISIAVNSARRWDLNTGQAIGLPMMHDGGVYTLTVSPSGAYVATGAGDRTARVWNALTGQPITAPLRHEDWVVSLEFSPDEQKLLTASSDRKARLWNIGSSSLAVPAMAHDNEVKSARFSPNARWLLTASLDGTARIWNAANGEQIVEALNHSVAIHDAAFSPDGRYVATGSADRTAKLWEVTSDRPAVEPLKHDHQVNSACFSPDGRLLATVSHDRTARIWNVFSAKPVTQPLRHEKPVISVAFSPDGKLLATGSEDGTAQIWEVSTGNQLFKDALPHGSWVNSVSFSPDGKWLVTASEDRRARVWEIATGSLVYEPLRHDGIVKSATFSPDGKWIITASYDKNVRVWNASTREPVSPTMEHNGEVRTAALSPDGRWVITGSEDKTARIWDPVTGRPIIDPLPHDGPVELVAFTPAEVWNEKKWVLTVCGRVARIWDATTGKAITEPLKHNRPIRTASFGPHGNLLVTAAGTNVLMWETISGRLVTEPLEHEKEVRSVTFSPDGNFIVTTSADQAARIWLATLRGKAPAWFSELSDAVGGYRLDNHGAAEVFSGSWENFVSVRSKVMQAPENDPFAIWTRWFLSERTTRTISAFSSTTLDEYIRGLVEQGSEASINTALNYQPNHAPALVRLARLSKDPLQSDFLSRLAEQYEPHNPDVLWVRAQILQQLNRPAEALAVMERAIDLDPRNVRMFGTNGIEFTAVPSENINPRGWLPIGWQDFSDARVLYSRVFDGPLPSLAALQISVEPEGRTRAELRGPRIVCKKNSKLVVEGWVRSATKTDLSVVLNQFVEPFQKYREQTVRTTPQWKPFRIQFTSSQDIAAELRLLQSSGGSVQLAGVNIRQE
ncbi:MAG: TIR domain-containing protein [Limisphaerales bacterium]